MSQLLFCDEYPCKPKKYDYRFLGAGLGIVRRRLFGSTITPTSISTQIKISPNQVKDKQSNGRDRVLAGHAIIPAAFCFFGNLFRLLSVTPGRLGNHGAAAVYKPPLPKILSPPHDAFRPRSMAPYISGDNQSVSRGNGPS